MIVTIKEREADDYGEGELFLLNAVDSKGEHVGGFSAGHGEPEDNYLFRDLSFVYDVEGLMKAAYEAGKNGEEFTVVKEEATEDDY